MRTKLLIEMDGPKIINIMLEYDKFEDAMLGLQSLLTQLSVLEKRPVMDILTSLKCAQAVFGGLFKLSVEAAMSKLKDEGDK